jgi:hypothetical protein
MKKILALACTSLVLVACVTVDKSVQTMKYSDNPVPQQMVKLLLASMNDTISPSCERVAILSAKGDEDIFGSTDIYDELRKEAGVLGANNVYIQNEKEPDTSSRVFTAFFGGINHNKVNAIALYCPKE